LAWRASVQVAAAAKRRLVVGAHHWLELALSWPVACRRQSLALERARLAGRPLAAAPSWPPTDCAGRDLGPSSSAANRRSLLAAGRSAAARVTTGERERGRLRTIIGCRRPQIGYCASVELRPASQQGAGEPRWWRVGRPSRNDAMGRKMMQRAS